MRNVVILFFVLIVTCLSPAATEARKVQKAHRMTASWYGSQFLEGAPMANGEPFKAGDPSIAAHRSWRLGTTIVITNPDTGLWLIAEVKDRGPYIGGRDIDLSWAAAEKLGYVDKGVTTLLVAVVHKSSRKGHS